jgi:hypothetical protein
VSSFVQAAAVAAVTGTVVALSVAGCEMVIHGIERADTTWADGTMMQNQLTCSSTGPGEAYEFMDGKLVHKYLIRSSRMCQWAFPSEYAAGAAEPVQTWVNPPVTLVLANGKVILVPGTTEWIFAPPGVKVG